MGIFAPPAALVLENVPPVPAALASELVKYSEFKPTAMASWHPTKLEMLISQKGIAMSRYRPIIIAICATFLCFPFYADAQISKAKSSIRCAAMLDGVYGWAVQGYQVPSVPTDPGRPKQSANLLAIAGTYTFDGKGKVARNFDMSVNGEIEQGLSDSGVYVVRPDCTATATIDTPFGPEDIKLTILQNGATIMFINVKQSVVLAGQLIRR